MQDCTVPAAAYIGMISVYFAAIIGATVGSFLAYRFSLRAAEIQMRRIARIKLRATFAPIIAEYNSWNEKGDLGKDKFIQNALIAPAVAIEEYRWFVPRNSQVAYQQAW